MATARREDLGTLREGKVVGITKEKVQAHVTGAQVSTTAGQPSSSKYSIRC